MFSEEQKKAWKNVSASNELKETILSEENVRADKRKAYVSNRFVRNISTAAACFTVILVLAIALIMPKGSDFTVSFDGETMEEGTVYFGEYGVQPLSAERYIADSTDIFEFTFEAEGKTTVSAKNGVLYLVDGDDVHPLESGIYSFEGKAVLSYGVDSKLGDEFELLIESGKNVQTIKVSYDALEQRWSVRKITANRT